jgi:GntR family transcriptional repressor for pyruvate dehydrogenase complex
MAVFDESMKVKRMPVNEQVFETMKDAIKNERWKAGEKIPSEVELAAMFDVNRLTVRTAMQRLIGMGLLETRVGDGTYVKEFSFENYMERASEFYLGPELLDKVYEFRNAIELESSRLAILHATESDIDELEVACETFENLKKQYLEQPSDDVFKEIVKADTEFHKKICEISHNDLFIYAFLMMQELLSQYIEIVLKERLDYWKKRKKKGEPWNDLHRVICISIRNRDFEACKKAHTDVIDYKIDLAKYDL